MPLALAGCGGVEDRADRNVLAAVEANAAAAAADDGRILCAQGAGTFVRACTLERTSDDRGLVLTLRRPDGGFRRLLVTHDGRGVVAADGAEPARVTVVGAGEIEVALGDDRYRLPATLKRAS